MHLRRPARRVRFGVSDPRRADAPDHWGVNSHAAMLTVTGPLLGTPVPAQAYAIDLRAFPLRAASWQVTTPQFGLVTITPGGVGSASASATAIPGHRELTGLQLIGGRTGSTVAGSYTIQRRTGAPIMGTMAWSAGGTRPAAPPLGRSGAPTPADVQSGAYAASLLTGRELSRLTGTGLPDPVPNGGRLEYQPWIDVSNAQSVTGTLAIDYSVYLGHTAALTASYWRTTRDSLHGSPTVAGPWLDARWYTSGPTLYVRASATRVLTVRVLPLKGVATASQTQRRAEAIARRLLSVVRR